MQPYLSPGPWNFSCFGLSTDEKTNFYGESPEGLVLQAGLIEPSGEVRQKGGKFTPLFDGISYYYQRIPKNTAYFSLEAKVRLDFISEEPDGQDGFGLILRDALGEDKVSDRAFMSNSAGLLVTSFRDRTGRRVKDTVGYRYVWDLGPDDVRLNRNERGRFYESSFSSRPAKVRPGQIFDLALVKNPDGVHLLYKNEEETWLQSHFPDMDLLSRLDQEYFYLGFATARACKITVLKADLKKEGPTPDHLAKRIEEGPYELPGPRPDLRLLRKTYVEGSEWTLPLLSNKDGHFDLVLEDLSGLGLAEKTLELKAREIFYAGPEDLGHIKLDKGIYSLKVRGPEERAFDFEIEVLEPLPFADDRIFVAPYPQGRPDGLGTEKAPLDLQTAIYRAYPGAHILLKAATYALDKAIEVPYGLDGEPHARIHLSCPDGKAVLDFSGRGGPFILDASYWSLENLVIEHSGPDLAGLQIGGSHNLVQFTEVRSNGNTGLQISAKETLERNLWPAHNRVRFCLSCDNKDPGQNNADGFAAKIACGEANLFEACLSYNNIDDGWDLFSKLCVGIPGAVEIRYCLTAYNGHDFSGKFWADGNGFKLGGEGLPIPHKLSRSFSFANDADGITSNSNPSVLVEDCVSVDNYGADYAIYGQGETAYGAELRGNIAGGGAEPDLLPDHLGEDALRQKDPSLTIEKLLEDWTREACLAYPEARDWLKEQIEELKVRGISREAF
jgi:hypothetical protein